PEDRCQASDPSRNVSETIGAVINAVHRSNDRQQHLGSADFGCRFLATNVLFPCLQRHPICEIAVTVDRYADETTGHQALIFGARGDIGCVRSAITHWYTETLSGPDGNVGA